MVRVVLFLIVSDGQVIEQWTCAMTKHRGFVEKVLKQIGQEGSKIIRTLQMNNLWVYFFQQQTFLFVLAAESAERSTRMQNYLQIIAQIFYENYDEKRFPTVLDKTIKEINRIESQEIHSAEEHEGLIVERGLPQKKERFSELLVERERKSRRAWLITMILVTSIIGLAILYLWRRKG